MTGKWPLKRYSGNFPLVSVVFATEFRGNSSGITARSDVTSFPDFSLPRHCPQNLPPFPETLLADPVSSGSFFRLLKSESSLLFHHIFYIFIYLNIYTPALLALISFSLQLKTNSRVSSAQPAKNALL